MIVGLLSGDGISSLLEDGALLPTLGSSDGEGPVVANHDDSSCWKLILLLLVLYCCHNDFV